MNLNQTSPAYQLKDELARHCLPQAKADPERRLAWVNSICLLFLVVGLAGAKSASISINSPRPLPAEIVSVQIEPPPPPVSPEEPAKLEPTEQEQPQAQPVVVTMDTPAINFSVPTLGNVVVPNEIAPAPPLNPMQPVAPFTGGATSVSDTGGGGDRPAPRYPDLAIEEMQEGPVTLLIMVNPDGAIAGVYVKTSSGHPLLDRAALDQVKKRWIMPRTGASREYETTIKFQLTAPKSK